MNIKHVSAALAAILAVPATQADPLTPAEAHQRVFRAVKAVRDTIIPAPAIHFVETFPPIAIPRQKILQLAQVQPAGLPPTPVPPPDEPPPPPSSAMDAAARAVYMADRAVGSAFAGMFSSKSRKPLIVSASERDPKTLLQMEEDLNVMMRIIEKAASTREETKVMGIDVFALGGANSPRVFYIDGHGAMFLLRVKYPLLAPPSKDDEPRTTDTSTEWEKARQEVYGRGTYEDRLFLRDAHGEDFDAERVEKLKAQLSDDLANATHIRHLKSDEFVTVVVSGGAARDTVVRQESRTGKGAGYGVSHKSSGGDSQSTMTLRAKKADIDSLAKGKLKPEEFRKRVSVQIY